MNEAAVKERLKLFVIEAGRTDDPESIDDHTPLLERRHLTSLQIPELLLLIEELRGEEIDVLALQAGDVQDIDTIWKRFFT